MITITVVGGTGTYTADFGNASYEAISLLGPDSTPMYDLSILNEAGILLIGANDIDAQRTKISENFQLIGLCSIQISSAVDDGTYYVHLFQRQ